MAATQIPTSISLRNPSPHTLSSSDKIATALSPPPSEWMTGTWHVTHSTLPMWKGKSNVRITYSPLQDSNTLGPKTSPAFDDLVEYQKSAGSKFSSVHGVSRPAVVPDLASGWAFSWRGKGWLRIASSQWEVLGWGKCSTVASSESSTEERDWVVTYFGKTLFTPAGIDIYCRSSAGLSKEALNAVKRELVALTDPSLKALAETTFEIPRTE